MTDDIITEEPMAPIAVEMQNDAPPSSLMEQMRARRQEIADKRTTKVPIPGYEEAGHLKGEYRLLDRRETEAIGRRVRKQAKGNRGEFEMLVLCDVIINAAEGFYVTDGGQEIPLTFGDDGPPITRYEELAKFLGYEGEPPNARAALYYVFGNNEFAIGGHGIVLNRWFGNTGIDVDAEFLGEVTV